MAKRTKTEQTATAPTKNVSAPLTEREHYTFSTYVKVMDLPVNPDEQIDEAAGETRKQHTVGSFAALILSDWVRQNVNADDLRAKVIEQLGL